jgi:Transposase, Mutator family
MLDGVHFADAGCVVAPAIGADGGLLVVIDRAKALAIAVGKVFGDTAFIQRCTLHKRRDLRDHLPRTNKGGSIAGSPSASPTRTASRAWS